MGVASSKSRKGNEGVKSRTPPLSRGTSRSPPEANAWSEDGTRSEPDTSRDELDWRNVSNTSYNLLDLQPYYIKSSPPPSPSLPPTPMTMKSKRTLSPLKNYRQSPERKKKTSSPIKRNNNDRFRDFKNITEKRDIQKGLPYSKPRSPSKKPRSPEKNFNTKKSPGFSRPSPEKIPKKSKLPVSLNKSLPELKKNRNKSPYEKPVSSPLKKPEKPASDRGRRNSFPKAEKVVPSSKKDFKKPDSNSGKNPNPENRRLSDVSVIGLEEKPVFRPIRNTKPKSSEEPRLYQKNNTSSSSSSKSKKSRNRVSPPPGAKSYSRGSSHGSIKSFTNIGSLSLKSATNSFASNRSNFEINAKIDRFNDKKQSLALMDLAKHTILNNSFRDAKMPGGPQTAYEQAKKDFAKEEWADKLSGIEKIVTIARKAPEVLKVDLKEVVKLMLVELQNLRSQVCRAAALAWAELFFALGRGLEPYIDNVVVVLLQKAADTNKFIRESNQEALLSMVENVSVNKAILSVCEGGINSKSNVVRTQVAMLIDHVISSIGPERFYGSSKDTQISVYTNGTKMLSDGSLEVRTHAKHMFGVLARHANFEPLLKEIVPDREIRSIQKNLDAIMNQM